MERRTGIYIEENRTTKNISVLVDRNIAVEKGYKLVRHNQRMRLIRKRKCDPAIRINAPKYSEGALDET